jgi:superfamily I DNA and/or RNA helicase
MICHLFGVFEHLFVFGEQCSLPTLVLRNVTGVVKPMLLEIQYRSRDTLGAFISSLSYEQRVVNASTCNTADTSTPLLLLLWGDYVEVDAPAYPSSVECTHSVTLAKLLQRKHPTKSLAILTFYNAQIELMKHECRQSGFRCEIRSVDSSQGSEWDIVRVTLWKFLVSNLNN